MDWDVAVVDSSTIWEVTLRTRGITTLWGSWPAPESLTVDVTPRRTQAFRPTSGQRVAWRNMASSNGTVLQADTVEVDALGRVTIPNVKVRVGGVRLVLILLPDVLDAPGASTTARTLLAPFTNPSARRATFAGAWGSSGPAELAVFDVTGRRARTLVTGAVAAGPWRTTADLSGLAPGVYLVRAEQAGVARTRRLILLR